MHYSYRLRTRTRFPLEIHDPPTLCSTLVLNRITTSKNNKQTKERKQNRGRLASACWLVETSERFSLIECSFEWVSAFTRLCSAKKNTFHFSLTCVCVCISASVRVILERFSNWATATLSREIDTITARAMETRNCTCILLGTSEG